MQVTIEIAELVAVVRKEFRFAIDVEEFADWPEQSKTKILAYGFQQILNDAAASAKNSDEVDGLVTKRVDNLRAGLLRASPIRVGDPVAKEARAIAVAKVRAAWVKKYGSKPGKSDRDEFNRLVTELAVREDVIETAKANVAATEDLEIEIEI